MTALDSSQGRLGRADRWRDTGVYGFAHLGKSLFWYGGEILFAYFLTEIAGLSPAAMATVLVFGFVLSAGLDLLVAARLSRWLADAASAGRLQLVGAAACGATLLAFFATPFVPFEFRLIHALAAGGLFRLAYALYDVAQNSLMSLAGADASARTRIAATRIAFSGLASLLVAAAVAPLLSAKARDQDAGLLISLALAAAVTAIGSAALLSRTLGAPRAAVEAPPGTAPVAAIGGLGFLWPLLAMTAVMSLALPLFQKLEPYFAVYGLRSAGWGGAIILALAAGVLVGQPAWFVLSRRWARGRVIIVAAGVQAAGAFAFLVSPISAPSVLVLGALGVGLGNGGLGMAMWAAFSDVVSVRVPTRQALAFALFSAMAKISLAAGVLFLAVLLDVVTYKEAHGSLRLLMAAGPILGSLGMVALAWRIREPGLAEARP